jgi:hypothetical protein
MRPAARRVDRSAIAGGHLLPVSFGLEAQGNGADFKVRNASLQFPGQTNRTWINSFGRFTGQIGYAWDRTLFFVKGGAAVTDNKYTAISTLPPLVGIETARETPWVLRPVPVSNTPSLRIGRELGGWRLLGSNWGPTSQASNQSLRLNNPPRRYRASKDPSDRLKRYRQRDRSLKEDCSGRLTISEGIPRPSTVQTSLRRAKRGQWHDNRLVHGA